MKAMILAAGLGTRLRPLTYKTPKPLLPVKGKPLIRYALDILKKAGIHEVIVNLHHLPKPLKSYLKHQRDFKIHFSYEKKILGTGGGIQKVKAFFGNEPFVVMNSDVIMYPDLKKIIALHKKKKALATMLVRTPKPKETYSQMGVSSKGKIKVFQVKNIPKPLKKAMFTGIHVFHPEIFKYFPKKKIFCINQDVYTKLVQKNRAVYAQFYKGTWIDLGTLAQYRANLS